MLVVVRTVLQDLAVGRDKLEVAECPGDCCEGTGLVGSSLSTINSLFTLLVDLHCSLSQKFTTLEICCMP